MPILRFESATYSVAEGQQAARILSALISSFEVIYDEGGQLVMQCRGSPELFAEICAWGSATENDEPEADEEDARGFAPMLPDEVEARRLAPWRIAPPEAAIELRPSPVDCPLALAHPGQACRAAQLGLCDRLDCPMRADQAPAAEPQATTLPEIPASPPGGNVVPLRRRPALRRLGHLAAAAALLMFSPALMLKHHGLDVNGDGVVDARDFALLFNLDALGPAGAVAADWRPGDRMQRHVKVGDDVLEVLFEKASPGNLVVRAIDYVPSAMLASFGGQISRRCYDGHMQFFEGAEDLIF